MATLTVRLMMFVMLTVANSDGNGYVALVLT